MSDDAKRLSVYSDFLQMFAWLCVYVALLVMAYKCFGLVTLVALLMWRWSAVAHHYFLVTTQRGEDEEGTETQAHFLEEASSL